MEIAKRTFFRLRRMRPRQLNTPVLLVALSVSLALTAGVSTEQQASPPSKPHATAAASSESLTLQQSQATSTGAAAPQPLTSGQDESWAGPTREMPSNAASEAQTTPSVSVSVSTTVQPPTPVGCLDAGTCTDPVAAPTPSPSPTCPTCDVSKPGTYRCMMIACPVDW